MTFEERKAIKALLDKRRRELHAAQSADGCWDDPLMPTHVVVRHGTRFYRRANETLVGDLYRSGVPCGRIASELGLTLRTVYRALRRAGVRVPGSLRREAA